MKSFAFSLLTLLSIAGATAQAQTAPVAATSAKKGTETVQFKTSAVCDMCKARIEKSMAYEKGVQAAHLDVPSKVLTVSYRADKTTPEALRAATMPTTSRPTPAPTTACPIAARRQTRPTKSQIKRI
jgi:mercuric ion binding protein